MDENDDPITSIKNLFLPSPILHNLSDTEYINDGLIIDDTNSNNSITNDISDPKTWRSGINFVSDTRNNTPDVLK